MTKQAKAMGNCLHSKEMAVRAVPGQFSAMSSEGSAAGSSLSAG